MKECPLTGKYWLTVLKYINNLQSLLRCDFYFARRICSKKYGKIWYLQIFPPYIVHNELINIISRFFAQSFVIYVEMCLASFQLMYIKHFTVSWCK